ncbi:MAG TPA: alpha/beta hydrolase [Chthoniobacteraceae bacterium]|jgi:acetyl esterase/lipase|nr:alpha/beta hydrolase [Chthoniobacteraceae bacterium]
MKLLPLFLTAVLACSAHADETTLNAKLDLPYVAPAGDPLQTLDVYGPPNAKNLPVVVWIHGGGWQAGDKKAVNVKPQAFVDRGFVFVSVNYRLLPAVIMADIFHDVAKSVGWVHQHIAELGGDPHRLFVMGHSAGAQLAALLCTDERYLKAEGVPFADLKGCVPVDGDTYDIPLVITTATEARKAAGKPEPTFGHREKFEGTPEKWAEYSAVNHLAKDKGIPPFLLLHVTADPSTTAQAQRLGAELAKAGLSAKLFGANDTNHSKLDHDLGIEGDPATKELYAFVDGILKR